MFKPTFDDVSNLLSKKGESNISFRNATDDSKLINIEHFKFTYANTQYELEIPSFRINQGDKIIISGKSGNGKTTLLKIIMGVINVPKGRITIFSNSISDLASYWQEISYVDNDTHIFSGSLLYNITLQNSLCNIDTERYMKIVNKLGISVLENNELWQNGRNLSGGQRVKICLARALYKNCQVIFLDEPLASLDKESQNDIISVVEEIPHTCIIVSHNPSISRICNRHFVIENGVINEQ